jgi:pyruvate kinase
VIRKAADWRKPVITATQMLESMIENPRPTRAEASDVANAIFDGTDAVMLSAETASGKYPREAVAIMSRIVIEAERSMLEEGPPPRRRRTNHRLSVAETICESMAHAANDLDMCAIAVFTESGNTAKLISKYRPKAQIFGFSHMPHVCNRMNLLWGVQPVSHQPARSAEDMVDMAERELLDQGKVRPGEVMGVVAGTRLASGSTNFMRLHVVRQPDPDATDRSSKSKPKAKRK